jgi:Phage portal protein, SPP1 Gp6-like
MTPDQIKISKYWRFPLPKSNYTIDSYSETSDLKVSQQKFYDEYHPSGHGINDPAVYPNIEIRDESDKIIGYHPVNRISLPFQKDSVDIVLAHLLGNKTQFSDSTVGENNADIMSKYKEFWDVKNMDVLRNDLIKSVLSVGDGAALFYRDITTKEFKWKVLSFLDREQIYEKKDKYGDMEYFGRFYSQIDNEGVLTNYCDIIDKTLYTTYSNSQGEWTVLESSPHGFRRIPVVYYFRKSGPFWTAVQSNIHNLEVMISRLSEDNKTKTKAKYHLKTDNPSSVATSSAGGTDLVITDTTGDFKLISGADISTQFKFEWETCLEIISNSLGMVFPKSKSSGDMPTGSMKMMFYPTERIVFQLINEFNSIIDKVNGLYKEGMMFEHPELANELSKLNVNVFIKMFSPQDDASVMTMLGQGKALGVISTQTAAENAPYATNDEYKRIEEEQAAAAAQLALDTNPQPIINN